MKIKVCGMKYPGNIAELAELPIQMMGMIFYPKSPRYIGQLSQQEIYSIFQHTTSREIDRVGIFVDEDFDTVLAKVKEYALDIVQLHGNEPADYVKEINLHLPVIKAFSISCKEDLQKTNQYEGLFGYFLFDTKTPQHGGSGQKFDWSVLEAYTGKTPFLLSGGIGADDAEAIRQINHPRFYGIDLNSRFETEPGQKDIELLKQFINKIKP